jgi:UDP-2,3-diacylglucosamine pyrophosphatase LpxH
VLNIDGKKAWIFHGDVFDVTMQHSKWLAKLGAVGYDTLILINSFVNWFLTAIGRQKMSFSQKVKASFKEAVKFINQFEQTAADLAVDKQYGYVICGHIHHAEIREITSTQNTGSVLYLNSGDWVESLSALEYHNGKWEVFKYKPDDFNTDADEDDKTDSEDLNAMLDVKNLLERFKHEHD